MKSKKIAFPASQVTGTLIEKDPKSPEQLFADRYVALCNETGFQIAFVPQWKQSMDTGSYSLVVQPTIIVMPKQNGQPS